MPMKSRRIGTTRRIGSRRGCGAFSAAWRRIHRAAVASSHPRISTAITSNTSDDSTFRSNPKVLTLSFIAPPPHQVAVVCNADSYNKCNSFSWVSLFGTTRLTRLVNFRNCTYELDSRVHDAAASSEPGCSRDQKQSRSEERRVGKECRSRWSPYH